MCWDVMWCVCYVYSGLLCCDVSCVIYMMLCGDLQCDVVWCELMWCCVVWYVWCVWYMQYVGCYDPWVEGCVVLWIVMHDVIDMFDALLCGLVRNNVLCCMWYVCYIQCMCCVSYVWYMWCLWCVWHARFEDQQSVVTLCIVMYMICVMCVVNALYMVWMLWCDVLWCSVARFVWCDMVCCIVACLMCGVVWDVWDVCCVVWEWFDVMWCVCVWSNMCC